MGSWGEVLRQQLWVLQKPLLVAWVNEKVFGGGGLTLGMGWVLQGGWAPHPPPHLCPAGKNPTDEYLEGMMSEAPGPINFTMFLTMFGEKLNGTDPEDVIRNAFACFDEEASGTGQSFGESPQAALEQCGPWPQVQGWERDSREPPGEAVKVPGHLSGLPC